MPVQRSAAKARQELARISEAKRRQARKEAAETRRNLKQSGQKVGKLQEDNSFRVGRTDSYDPETKRVRALDDPRDTRYKPGKVKAGSRPAHSVKPTTKPATEDDLRKLRVKGQQQRGNKTFAQLQRSTDAQKKAAIAGALPFVDKKDVKEAQDAVVGMPAGLYGLGKDLALDVVKPKGGPFDVRHSRTGHNVKELGKATYRDIRHPGRNPLLTALTVSGLASAGAGTATRLAAGSAALKEGGVAAGLKAAAKKPLPEVRTHEYTGPSGKPVKIAGRYSLNPSARAVQKLNDRRTKNQIGAAKYARLLHDKQRVEAAVRKAPAMKTLALSHKITTPEDMAIRVVAEGVPIDDVIAYHEARAAAAEVKLKNRRRGGVPGGGHSLQQTLRIDRANRRHLKIAALLKEAKQYVVEGADGTPEIKPGSSKYIERAYASTEKTSLLREKRAQAAGDLSLQAAERRKNAPGEMMRRTVSGGRAFKIEEPRTVAEARARFDELDAQVNRIVSGMVRHEYQMNPDEFKLNATSGKAAPTRQVRPEDIVYGKHGQGVDIQRTGEKAIPVEESGGKLSRKRTATQLAEDEFYRKLEASTHPTAMRLKAMMDEREQLRRALASESEKGTFAEGLTEGGSLGTKTTFKGIEEMEPFNAGKFRVPDALPSKRQPHGPPAYRGGIQRTPGSLSKEYTGALRVSGKVTPHTMKATAESGIEFERFDQARQLAKAVRPTGAQVRPADTPHVKYAPVKTDVLSREQLQQLREAVADNPPDKLTPDQAAALEETIAQYSREYFPDEGSMEGARWGIYGKKTPPGTSIQNVVWVDKKLLASQRQRWQRLPVLDDVSDAVKGLILYGKPGYVAPNLLGNVGYNLMHQGFLAPSNWARAIRVPKDIGFMLDEAGGSGFSRALAEGTLSRASFAVQKAGNFWSLFVDEPFRRAAILHELRRVGVKSDTQIRDFFEKGHPRQAEIIQRARDAIVEYERLGPAERDMIRRVLFVYPWIKGSTWYAAQFLRDHPIQAAVFTKIGQQGSSQALEELGPLPAWAQGSFKVGGSEDRPYIVNPNSISPFSTPSQVVGYGSSLLGGGERSEQIGEGTNPVLQAAIETAFNRDLFTGRELGGNAFERFGGQVGKGLPQYLLYKRGGLNFVPGLPDQHVSPDATYPYSPGDARGQFLGGSAFPRPANRAKLNDQAAGTLNPAERAKRRLTQEKGEVLAGLAQHAPKLLDGSKLEQRITKAYSRKEQVDTMRARVKLDVGTGEPYDRAVLLEELKLLRSWGLVADGAAKRIRQAAATGSWDDVKEWRDVLLNDGFEEEYLGLLREAKQEAGVK